MDDGLEAGGTSRLTKRQRAFVDEFLIDLNATQAALRAGYSPSSARAIASENLSKPNIRDAVDAALWERFGVSRASVVEHLARIAFANIGDYLEWDSEGVRLKPSADLGKEMRTAIAEISIAGSGKGRTVRLKLADKLAALEKLGRALGLFDRRPRAENHGNSQKDFEPSNEERATALAMLLSGLSS